MLVTCRKCGVSFAGGFPRCVSCGEVFAPTESETQELAGAAAVQMLEKGLREREVRRSLVEDYGLPQIDVDFVMADAVATLRQRGKSQGRAIAGSGLALLSIAFAAWIFTGGHLIATGCLALGASMVVLGGIKAWTGWNLTGNDDG